MEKSDLLCKVDELVDLIGEKELLEALCRAMSSDELESNLRYIDRMYETGAFNEQED